MNDIIYKRELNHSYMVIRCRNGDPSETYAYRMMTQNRIGRLLDCRQRQLDGEAFLYYDISSRQPLERLYEARKLNVEDLKHILYAVAAIQEDLGEYLLDEQGLLLDVGLVFTDVETEELYFCYDPENRTEESRYTRLADFFLGHVDHGDEHAVNIAYQFYKMSKAEYFVLSAFLPVLEKEENAWKAKQGEGMPPCWEEAVSEEILLPEGGWEEEQELPSREETEKKKGWLWRLFNGSSGRSRQKRMKTSAADEKGGKKRRMPWRKADGKEASYPDNGDRKKQPGVSTDWSGMIWDSYASRGEFSPNGETVYFADLERPAAKQTGMPCLKPEEAGSPILLEDLPLTVGKLKGKVSIVLEDKSVSRLHARLEQTEEGIGVRDLNSRNGTLVNGKKLLPDEMELLCRGDLVQFGRERFWFDYAEQC